jgi:hypothetical protein
MADEQRLSALDAGHISVMSSKVRASALRPIAVIVSTASVCDSVASNALMQPSMYIGATDAYATPVSTTPMNLTAD